MDLENGAIAALVDLNSSLTNESIEAEVKILQNLIHKTKTTFEESQTNKSQLENILQSMFLNRLYSVHNK